MRPVDCSRLQRLGKLCVWNPSECEGPHTWRHQTNGADGGRHPRQVGSHRTSSEALNHAAVVVVVVVVAAAAAAAAAVVSSCSRYLFELLLWLITVTSVGLYRRHIDQCAQWAPHHKKPRSSVNKASDRTGKQVPTIQQMPSLPKLDYQEVRLMLF